MLNRIEPAMPAGAYQTYAIHAPSDRMVKAACHDVDCPSWRHGWITVVDEAGVLGKAQADYIRNRSGRTFTEKRSGDGMTIFSFPSGQRCFAEHHTRREIYTRSVGDWRAQGATYRHSSASGWVDDFAEHQGRLAESLKRG